MANWLIPILVTFGLATARAAPSPSLAEKYEALQKRLQSLQVRYSEALNELNEMDSRVVDIANVCEGRLTTESGVAVSTSDRSNQTTLYFTPYKGNNCSLYDGSLWEVYRFSERSLALSGLTANRNYDVFLYDNSGTLTLELTLWTSDTVRATALVLQDGIYVRSGATTRRYLGTIRVTSTTQTQDTAAQRFVWNYQNRVPRVVRVVDTTNTWAYTTNSWRSANNSAANRVEYVAGVSEVFVEVSVLAIITNGTGTLNYYSAGVGIDSTTTNSAQIRGSGSDNNVINQVWGDYSGYPGVGYHFLQWVERSAGTSITVWGDNGNTAYQSGLLGMIDA